MKKNFLLILFFISIYCMPGDLLGKAVEEKKHILFIVNPISHEIKGLNFQEVIEKNLDHDQFEYKIVYTQYPQHATQLAQEALLEEFDIVAAVGGDGTVNEVGTALIHSEAILAIIPVGSGNGLARHLGIPIGIERGIKALNQGYSMTIDTAKMNGKNFLGIAGIGFDSHIAKQFAIFGKRGFFSYCQVVLREFPRYRPQYYHMTIDGKQLTKKAFILTFANSSQYGNDFIIAPQAKIDDGYLDLIIIDDIPGYSILKFLYQFKHGTLNRSNHFESYRFKELIIHNSQMQTHVDGEPIQNQNHIRVIIQPKSLKILAPTGI